MWLGCPGLKSNKRDRCSGPVEVWSMQFGKTIGGKLYWGFGSILTFVILLSLVDLVTVAHEQGTKDTYKQVINMARQMSDLTQAIMYNRLHLRNFLLNGDSREAELLNRGMDTVNQLINKTEETANNLPELREKAKSLLETIRATEKDWADNFATPLIEKRKQVDAGSATVAELQIAYLQANPGQEQKREEEPLNQMALLMTDGLAKAENSDKAASYITIGATILGMFLMVGLGLGV